MVSAYITIVVVILAVLIFLRFIPLGLWISALASGVHVSVFTLAGMRIRRVSPAKIVSPLIKAEKAGLHMDISKMEAHYLAGGNLDRVVTALITARGANIQLDFPEACAIDLAGRVVQTPHKSETLHFERVVKGIFGEKPEVPPLAQLHLLAEYAEHLPHRAPILMTCGTEDPLYPENEEFYRFLKAHGLTVTFESWSGAHEWRFGRGQGSRFPRRGRYDALQQRERGALRV